MDTGKPLQEANVCDIASGADCIEYFASAAAMQKGEYHDFGQQFATVERVPLGVIAGIGAWNYPFQIACWKSAPALAAGNAMVFKPSELTVMSACHLAEIYEEAGLPKGVFQVVLGDAEVGKYLVKHPGIHKVTLTGEVSTGQAVYQSCAQDLKHVTLELGGKSPLLIFNDSDLKNAVRAAMLANFYTQGQICSNGTRVFVQKGIKQQFEDLLSKATAKLFLGDPRDLKTQQGSLINAEHQQKVMKYINAGKQDEASLLFGGEAPEFPSASPLKSSSYVLPTAFTNCTDDMTIVKEEIFGPVMSILEFETEEEAIQRANQTPFGLGSGVFSGDFLQAKRVSQQLESGICWVNTYNITPIEVPFGGMKMSGVGRENSQIALEHYTQPKTTYFESGDVDSPYEV